MISQNILKLIGDAMKARDNVRVATLRSLSSELKNAKINIYDPNASEQRELTEQEEIAVIRREVKKRKEAILAYSQLKNQRTEELKKREEEELRILQEFLPLEMSEDEVKQIVDEVFGQIKPQGIKDMGKVMGAVKAKAPSADGSMIANMIRNKLTQ